LFNNLNPGHIVHAHGGTAYILPELDGAGVYHALEVQEFAQYRCAPELAKRAPELAKTDWGAESRLART